LAVGHLKTCAKLFVRACVYCRHLRGVQEADGRATWWTMQQCREVMPRTSRRKEAIHIHRWIERTNEPGRWPRFASHCMHAIRKREREGGREENDALLRPPPMATRAGGGGGAFRTRGRPETHRNPSRTCVVVAHPHNQAHAEEEIARWTDAELILVLTIYHQ
jgi:hypothetical protein